MSVVIKGTDIPQSCYMCDMIELSGAISCLHANNPHNSERGRALDCPLIELPDHGDLIDRDEQIERAWRLKLNTRELITEMLNTATVVIPAERSAKVCPLHCDDEVTEYCVEGPCMDEMEDRCPIAERNEE